MTEPTPTLMSRFFVPKSRAAIVRPWLRRSVIGLLVVCSLVFLGSLVADLVSGNRYQAAEDLGSAAVLLMLGPQLFGRRPVGWLGTTLSVIIVAWLVVAAWGAWSGRD